MKRALAAVLPYALFLVLAAVSWNRWVQPYVDTGRELMTPWRVARGQMLYRDVQWYHGPLAPYLAAAVDRLSGRRLEGRIGLAVLLALLNLEALRRLAQRALPLAPATLATSLTVATAFFLRPGGWFFPFSFDTAIAVAAIGGALVLLEGRWRSRDVLAGACLLAALLSRLELGLVAMLAILWETRRERSRWALLGAGPVAVSAFVYFALSLGTPVSRLVRDGWLALLRPPEAYRSVYRAYAGLDRPGLRLAELALAAILLLLAAGLVVGACAVASRRRSGLARAVEAGALLFLAAAALLSLRPPDALARVFWLFPPLVRVVPPLVIGAGLLAVGRRAVRRSDPLPGLSDATLIVAAFFSARLLLAAGYVGPYDAFFLPLPLLIATALLFQAADAASPAVGGALPRLTAGSLTIFLMVRVAATWDDYRSRPWIRIETPVGPVRLVEPLATATRLALADLAARLPAGGRLVGFPEGGFFNYALGFENPLPIDQFFPGHLQSPAEEKALISQIEAAPPDAVLIANVLAIGEQRPAFGKDYYLELDRFLRTRFAAAATYGPGAGPDPRIGDPQFFVTIRVPRGR